MDWKLFAYYAPAFLAALIAALALVISYWNWKLAKDKWRLDLYEHRYKTYNAVMDFVALMTREIDASDFERYKFLNEAKQNEFLFKPEIITYIDTLYKKSVRQMQLHRLMSDTVAHPPNTPIRSKLTEESMEIGNWFAAQLTEAKKKFGPYLRNDKH